MIPEWADEKVYELFKQFIQKCVLTDDSFLTDEKEAVTLTAIDDCIERFIVKGIEGKGTFEDKIIKQFADAYYNTKLTFAHVNWLWCMSPSDFGINYKKTIAAWILGDSKRGIIRDDIYPSGGFGDAGPALKFRKHKEISFLLLIMKQLKQNVHKGLISNLQQAIEMVEKICIECRFNFENETSDIIDENIWKLRPEGKLAMYNILLHLCMPDKYEPIASDGHKNRIQDAFKIFIEDAPNEVKESNREQQILYIRDKVAEIIDDDKFTFYDEYMGNIWGWGGIINSYEYEFDPLTALQYKKAIILYGPPGTSKTYSAEKIAENVILRYHLPKCTLKNYLKTVSDQNEIDKIVKDRIHKLQLHINYNYEDFIAGIKLIDGKTVPQKGYLLNLIEKKIAIDDYPHVLILDEINRVDLSRLFGEFFSAIESRDEEINTSIGGFILKVPQNLLIIGTMNEIDFSLERVDFALRRRFAWFPFGFDPQILRDIIKGKISTKITDEELEKYIINCQTLNDKIDLTEELGSQYQIGHTFFAEVAEIYNQYSQIQGKDLNSIFDLNGPVRIVWDISIEPLLKAFFGNMDKTTRENKINEFKSIFVNGE